VRAVGKAGAALAAPTEVECRVRVGEVGLAPVRVVAQKEAGVAVRWVVGTVPAALAPVEVATRVAAVAVAVMAAAAREVQLVVAVARVAAEVAAEAALVATVAARALG
jgi:hypothetical protein